MKKFLYSSVALVAFSFALWISAHVFLRVDAPDLIERILKEKTGLIVQVSAVRTRFLTSFEFRNIELKQPISVVIPRLIVSFHFSVFPIRVELINPQIRWKLSTGSSVRSPLPPLPVPIQIEIVDGDVIMMNENRSWRAHDVAGTARMSALIYDAQIQGLSADFGHFQGQAALDHRLNQPWRASFLIPKVRLERLHDNHGMSGVVRLEGHASGAWLAKKILQDWKVSVAAKNIHWKPNESTVLGPLRGGAQLTPRGIQDIDFALEQARVRGTVSSVWSTPHLDLTVRISDGSEIKELLRSAGMKRAASSFGGHIGALAQVRGTPAHPIVSGSFNSEPVLGLVRWPLLQGDFSYENKALRMDADTLSGHASVKGNFSPAKSATLQLTLNQLSLGQLAKFNEWKNVRGMLDGKGELVLSDSSPSSTGSFRVHQFEWGRLKTKPLLEGTFSVNDRKVQLRTGDHGLDLALVHGDDVWNIQRAQVELNPASDVNISGAINTVDKSCDLHFSGKNIPPDVWPPLVARYPSIAGVVNITGTVHGALSALQSKMEIDFSKIQFAPDLKIWNGHAQAHGEGTTWSVNDFTVTPGYHGHLEWASQDGIPSVHVTADIKNADPQFLFDLARSTAVIAGKLNGTTDVRWNGRDLVGISSAAWSPGKVGNFAFDVLNVGARFEKNRIYLDDFSLVRGQQALHGHAELNRLKKDWDVVADVQFQNWGIPSLALNGETAITGEAGIDPSYVDLSFTTPFLELNNVPLEDMVAKARYHHGAWELTANAQDFANVNLKGNVNNDSIIGSVSANGLDLKSYLPRLLPNMTERPEGRADIVLTLNGTFADPNAHLNFKSTDILWREEHLSPTFNATYRDGVIVFHDGRVNIRNGGSLHFSGNISHSEPFSLEMQGSATKLSLQSAIHLIQIPLRWQGRLDGTFEVSIASGHTNISISFEGTHDGFALFEDGGKISGKIIGTDDEWNFSEVRINTGDGYVSTLPDSKVYLEKNGSATMHVGADVRNVRTGPLSLFGGVEVTGSWKKQPSPDGVSPPTTETELEIFARSLWVNHYVLDGTITRLNIGHGQLEFSPIPGSGQQMSGVLHYEDFPTLRLENFRLMDRSQEKLFLNGLIGANKWDFDLRAHQVSTDILRSLLNSDLSMDGALDINVKGLGTPANPDLAGHVIWHNGKVGLVPLDLAECDLHYQDHYLNITKLNATRKNGYALSGNARFYAGSDDTHELDPDIDLQVDKGDLSFLRDMVPSINHARGTFSGHVRMLKKSWGTSIAGFFDADKISLSTLHVPDLEKGILKIQLDKNRLHIEEAKARLGGGDLRLSGYIDFTGGVPSFYNLALQTQGEKGIKVRVPELSISPGPVLGKIGLFRDRFAGASQGEPLVNLILKGPADAPLLAGAVTLENTVFTYPPSAQQPHTDESSDVTRWVNHFLENLQWDISVVAGHRTWYQNELVDANIQGDVQFKGFTHDLNVQGTITTEQGALVYSGNEFQIRNASLEIVPQGPLLNDASTKQTLVYLKATADRDVFYTDNVGDGTEDTIVMEVDRSLLGEVQPRFHSKNNPNLSPEKALQLALGLPLSTPVDTDTLLPDQRVTSNASKSGDVDAGLRLGLIQLLDSSLASPLARAIARNTGLVDYIRVSYQEKDKYEATDPLAGTTSLDANNNITQSEFLKYAKGTKVKFGKGLSDRLFADYSFRVDQYQNQLDLRHELELSYRVHRNLFLRGTTELDREQTLGRPPDRRAVLENQWRFGLPRRPILDPDSSNPPPKPT